MCEFRIMRRYCSILFVATLALASFASPFAPIVTPASAGRTPSRISIRGNRIVAFGPAGERIWQWSSPYPVTDAMIGWRGYVYVTSSVGTIVALGYGGGRVWSTYRNGAYSYVQIERYGADGFAARLDLSAYRERFNDPSLTDAVDVFKRNEFIRSVGIPANARLVVHGSHLYAVYRRHGRLHRWHVL
jgi:hypothetical protein